MSNAAKSFDILATSLSVYNIITLIGQQNYFQIYTEKKYSQF